MWESPIYKFRVPKSRTMSKAIELTFNVTKSIPKGKWAYTMAADFVSAINELLEEKTNIKKVVEFGAGNLKNIPFILKKGKIVHAIDFKEVLDQNTTQAHLKKCLSYSKKFGQIIFPQEFIGSTEKYDLAILSHTIPIMPVFIERLMALQYLYSKLNSKGLLLWHSQIESTEYKRRRLSRAYDCGDGIWLGKNMAYRTFFKHFEPIEIDEIMAVSGLLYEKKYKCAMGHIRLYKKIKYNVFKDFYTSDEINEVMKANKTFFKPVQRKDIIVELKGDIKPIIPNLPNFSLKELYIKKLDSIKKGPGSGVTMFHRLSAIIFWFCLYSQIDDIKIEKEIDEGLGRVDIIFKNRNKEGFFKDLKELANILCPKISVECKNYTKKIKNPEIGQLASRLNPQRGMIGFLLCREIDNTSKAKLLHAQRLMAAQEKKYLFILEDKDLKEMLNRRFQSSEEEVNAFLRNKYDELIE